MDIVDKAGERAYNKNIETKEKKLVEEIKSKTNDVVADASTSIAKGDLGSLKSYFKHKKAYPIAIVGLIFSIISIIRQVLILTRAYGLYSQFMLLVNTVSVGVADWGLGVVAFCCLCVLLLTIKYTKGKLFAVLGAVLYFINLSFNVLHDYAVTYNNYELLQGVDATAQNVVCLVFYVKALILFATRINTYKKASDKRTQKRAQELVLNGAQEAFTLESRKGKDKFLALAEAYANADDYQSLNTMIVDTHARFDALKYAFKNSEWDGIRNKILADVELVDGKDKEKEMAKSLKALYAVRDYEKIYFVGLEYDEKAKEKRREIMQETGKDGNLVRENDGEGKFDGRLIQQIGWGILCALVTIVTFGIAYPAALCWKEKWLKKHTLVDGVRLSFDGTGMQLFGNWIKWLLLTIVTLGIYSLWIPIKLEDWKAKHTHLNGGMAEFGGRFDGRLIQQIGIDLLCALVIVVTLGIALPAALCIKQRWLKKHTIIDGKRLEFDGTGMQLFGNWIKWLLLTIVTLGIYSLWIPIKLENWKAKHTHIKE